MLKNNSKMGLIFSKGLDSDTVEPAQKTSLAGQRQKQEANSFIFLEKKKIGICGPF